MHCRPLAVNTICWASGDQSLRARNAAETVLAACVPVLVACRNATSSASGRFNPSRLLAIKADCAGISG
jgi:hypothetical protein